MGSGGRRDSSCILFSSFVMTRSQKLSMLELLQTRSESLLVVHVFLVVLQILSQAPEVLAIIQAYPSSSSPHPGEEEATLFLRFHP